MWMRPGVARPDLQQARAVDGMHDAFVSGFRRAQGPGAKGLAEVAWRSWRSELLRYEGVPAASREAVDACIRVFHDRIRYAFALWICESSLRRAVRLAVERATTAS